MIVTLDIPDHISFQFVYRMERASPFAVQMDQGQQFVYLDGALQGIRYHSAIADYCGRLGAAKSIAKLGTHRRSMYLVTEKGRTLSVGWCTIGKCSYYKVESNAVVVGPIWTAENARGKGIAVKALKLAMNEHMRRGRSYFYIDTEKKNVAAQRVFEKTGFGSPVALYFR